MRRQILLEREKRKAAAAKERAAQDTWALREDADPAMAPVNDAVRRIAAHPNKDASAALLLRMLANVVGRGGRPSPPSTPTTPRSHLNTCAASTSERPSSHHFFL
jgi:hypothetical protein